MNTLEGMVYGGLEKGRIVYGIATGEYRDIEPVYFLDSEYRLYNRIGQSLTVMHPLELPNIDTLAYISGSVVLQGWGCNLILQEGYWGVE